MKTNEINIRDPYVLLHEDRYYLYGTRSESCWGEAEGFDCYVSADRENWEGPMEVFHRPEGFWADRAYWAPECVYYRDAFFLITTLGAADRKKGIYVLRSDSPLGPFVPFGARLSPEDWSCIDGTLYLEEGKPWLIFSHSFEDDPKGDMCLLPLKEDLSGPAGEPVTLFSAAEAPWARPVPFAKAEFGMDGDVYFTDGPCVKKLPGGELIMTWSSWSEQAYAVGVAMSENGRVRGPWRQLGTPLYPANGGHGMIFTEKDGSLCFTLHTPNDKYLERPAFYQVEGGCAADLKLRRDE
jgi:hypothetical protein